MKKIGLARVWIVLLCLAALLGTLSLGAAAASQDDAANGYAFDRLSAPEQAIYLFLHEQITKTANGLLTSTVFEPNADEMASLAAAGIQFTWTNKALGVESIGGGVVFDLFWEQFSFSKILSALLADCPYELYWYDKTTGASSSCSVQTSSLGDVNYEASVTSVSFRFSVAAAYRPADYQASAPCVELAKTKAAAAAVVSASAIVAKHAALSDYQKLIAYRDEICALVSYHSEAASDSYGGGYGDPWQLVYVFDNDPQTNVVCEGYAKAFQFLCDLSDFSGDVRCLSVSGTMAGGTGAGGHMWNLVQMEDGRTYLVDVTNSDAGTVGASGGLFLAGVSGSVQAGYSFLLGNTPVSFAYSSEMLTLWGGDGVLTLSDTDYQPATVFLDLPDTIVYDGEPLTAGLSASDIRYFYGGTNDLSDQYVWSHQWYADANGVCGAALSEAPRDAGSYWIVVQAMRGNERHEASARVTILPATPSYIIPTGICATYGDSLADITLPQGFAWKNASALVGNAGINRHVAIFTPTDTKNYHTVSDIAIDVTVSRLDISNLKLQAEEAPIYNGSLQTLEVRLPRVGDLEVTFTVNGNQATDVGSYTLTVTGNGNFEGSISMDWKLLPDLASLQGLTPETVTKNDRAAIEALRDSIKSEAARIEWAEVLATCNALLDAIAQSEALETEPPTKDSETAAATKAPDGVGNGTPDIVDLPAKSGCVVGVGTSALGLTLLVSLAALLRKKRN